jgi:SNF2 family DNA or RNA helicase
VVENWEGELERFAPSLSAVVMKSGDRTADHAAASEADVVITSYALLRRDFDQLEAIDWSSVILDEAQFIKNHQSQAYSQIRQLKADYKIALTGTPLENNLMDIWSIASVVAPGLFPKPKHFIELFQKPIEKVGDQLALTRLRTRLRPFMMRRTKSNVAAELPPKVEQILAVELSPKHRKLYDLHLQRERQKVLGLMQDGGLNKNRFAVLKSITLLRQLCLHPALADKTSPTNATIPSSKLETLRPLLEELLAEHHRVLIFSQFTSFLTYAKQMVGDMGITYSYLDGSTKQRGDVVKAFQEGTSQVFLISLKAGGVGLNLTQADYCVMLDPWWNPAAENQAIDRTHRIGQTNTVMVYRLIAKDTIEEKVLALQQKKRQLFQNVLEDGDIFSTAITEDDIRQIFD